MAEYAIYRHNVEHLFECDVYGYDYIRHDESSIYKIYQCKKEAKAALIKLERDSIYEPHVEARKEWCELSQDEILVLRSLLEKYKLPVPVRYINDKILISLDKISWNKLSDEQFLEFLELGAGGLYYLEELSEYYVQSVVYTHESGYLQKDPRGYVDGYANISNLAELAEIIIEYTVYYDETPFWNEINLTENDLSCSKFWELANKYESISKIETNTDKTSGKIIFLKHEDYQCMQLFNDVVDNPSFMIHDATNLDMMQIDKNPYQLLNKYKHRGRAAE